LAFIGNCLIFAVAENLNANAEFPTAKRIDLLAKLSHPTANAGTFGEPVPA
jgi:hypothetical protein